MSEMMHLRARVVDPHTRDEISDVLADLCLPKPVLPPPASVEEAARRAFGEERVNLPYIMNWYPDGLRERALGPHSRDRVGVTRYYPNLSPRVVVDFEPTPPDKWFLDIKRQFFTEMGIVFLPIELNAQLTPEDFGKRYAEAKIVAERGSVDHEDTEAVRTEVLLADVEGILATTEFEAAIDRLALVQAAATPTQTGQPLAGGALRNRAKRLKREIAAHYRERLKNGSMGADECYRELTDSAERRIDGQVPTSIAS